MDNDKRRGKTVPGAAGLFRPETRYSEKAKHPETTLRPSSPAEKNATSVGRIETFPTLPAVRGFFFVGPIRHDAGLPLSGKSTLRHRKIGAT